jgi:uncharacterized membrane protein YozB (DUF420 family)
MGKSDARPEPTLRRSHYNRRMYSLLLFLHSLLRWAVLLTGLYAVVRAITGMNGHRSWSTADAKPGMFFIISCDLQLLLGLALYLVFSPTVQAAFGNIGAAMRNPEYRFFVVEHAVGMIVAIALAHVGRARSKKATSDAARFKSAAIFYGLALVIILGSIPWPGMPGGRPLFRGM